MRPRLRCCRAPDRKGGVARIRRDVIEAGTNKAISAMLLVRVHSECLAAFTTDSEIGTFCGSSWRSLAVTTIGSSVGTLVSPRATMGCAALRRVAAIRLARGLQTLFGFMGSHPQCVISLYTGVYIVREFAQQCKEAIEPISVTATIRHGIKRLTTCKRSLNERSPKMKSSRSAQFAFLTLLLSAASSVPLAAFGASPPGTEVNAPQMIDAFEGTFGVHPGQRRNHIKGTCAAGDFLGTADAAALSRSALFSGKTIPVIARFDLGGGSPEVPDAAPAPRGMALEFHLPAARCSTSP